jgi:hypothetical protein
VHFCEFGEPKIFRQIQLPVPGILLLGICGRKRLFSTLSPFCSQQKSRSRCLEGTGKRRGQVCPGDSLSVRLEIARAGPARALGRAFFPTASGNPARHSVQTGNTSFRRFGIGWGEAGRTRVARSCHEMSISGGVIFEPPQVFL